MEVEEKMIYTYPELLNQLSNQTNIIEVKGKKIKEMIDVKLLIRDDNVFYSHSSRPLDKVMHYLRGEMCWYMSGSRSVKDIARYSKFWEKIQNEDGTANSNYGYLVFYKENKYGFTPFEWVIYSLLKDQNSRQAIMLYNDFDYFYDANKDFVCTQSQHMFIREDYLVSIVYLRSSDAILGLTYDIPWWSFVQQQAFIALSHDFPQLKNGNIIVNIGSSHIYEDKFETAEKMLSEGINSLRMTSLLRFQRNQSLDWYEKNINAIIKVS